MSTPTTTWRCTCGRVLSGYLSACPHCRLPRPGRTPAAGAASRAAEAATLASAAPRAGSATAVLPPRRHAAPLEARDPAQVGPFTLLGRLGAGGMGIVYLGRAARGRLVAVKVVRPELAGQRQFRARFAREVAAAASLDCPFTARVLDADTSGEQQWVASEFVDGPTLDHRIDEAGPLPPQQATALALGLAQALSVIHGRGLTHRDLKPSNIILALDGPKVIDFGVVHAVDASSLTQTGALLGTLAWMAPEQVTGDRVGPPADVFAWGLVAAYAALGRHPYGQGRPEVLAMRPRHVAADLHGLPPALAGAVQQALTVDPDRRPEPHDLIRALQGATASADQTAAAVAGVWDSTLAGPPIELPARIGPPSAVRQSPAPRRSRAAGIRNAIIGTALAASVVAAIAVAGGATASPESPTTPAASAPASAASTATEPSQTESSPLAEQGDRSAAVDEVPFSTGDAVANPAGFAVFLEEHEGELVRIETTFESSILYGDDPGMVAFHVLRPGGGFDVDIAGIDVLPTASGRSGFDAEDYYSSPMYEGHDGLRWSVTLSGYYLVEPSYFQNTFGETRPLTAVDTGDALELLG